MSDEKRMCEATSDGWICTLSPGHDGAHEAHGNHENTYLMHYWPASAPSLRAEVAELREKLAKVEARNALLEECNDIEHMTCVWCGQRDIPNDESSRRAHVESCDSHPLAAREKEARAEVERLKATVERLSAAPNMHCADIIKASGASLAWVDEWKEKQRQLEETNTRLRGVMEDAASNFATLAGSADVQAEGYFRDGDLAAARFQNGRGSAYATAAESIRRRLAAALAAPAQEQPRAAPSESALVAAHRAGEEAMRERAALRLEAVGDRVRKVMGTTFAQEAIRALPILGPQAQEGE